MQLSEHVIGGGPRVLCAGLSALGLEGYRQQALDARLSAGRTRTWSKVKCVYTDDFVIVGLHASEAAGGLGALLLAEPGDGTLHYVGKVGTGFSASGRRSAVARLEAFAPPERALAVAQGADAPGSRPI